MIEIDIKQTFSPVIQQHNGYVGIIENYHNFCSLYFANCHFNGFTVSIPHKYIFCRSSANLSTKSFCSRWDLLLVLDRKRILEYDKGFSTLMTLSRLESLDTDLRACSCDFTNVVLLYPSKMTIAGLYFSFSYLIYSSVMLPNFIPFTQFNQCSNVTPSSAHTQFGLLESHRLSVVRNVLHNDTFFIWLSHKFVFE